MKKSIKFAKWLSQAVRTLIDAGEFTDTDVVEGLVLTFAIDIQAFPPEGRERMVDALVQDLKSYVDFIDQASKA